MTDYQIIVEEFEQLKADLSQPAVVRDAQKMKELSRRFTVLEPVIEHIKNFQRAEEHLAQAQETLNSETDQDMISVAEQEIETLGAQKKQLTEAIAEALKPKDPLAGRDIIIEIRAGAGGDEAGLFAADLFRMYARFAERQGWKTKILSSSRTGIGGFKEVIFEIAGHDVYDHLRFESGVHRVQRIPDTEKAGRVHTSTATVAVLPEAEEVDIQIKSEDIRIDVFRAGGHGGQSVNTTDSAVRITHLPTGTVVACQDEKSQHQNKAKAMQILRSRVLANEQERLHRERSDTRKLQIGTGERSEKIRTYNVPQDRVTDHRIKQSWHNISAILDGDLTDLIADIKKAAG